MKQTFYAALASIIITIIIRFTVFTSDSNLLIVAATFIVVFIILSLAIYLFRKIFPKKTRK